MNSCERQLLLLIGNNTFGKEILIQFLFLPILQLFEAKPATANAG